VVSASSDKTFKVWDLASGRTLATLEGRKPLVTACAFTPDGQRVVSALWDHTLEVWDLASGHTLAILEGHADFVNACAVTSDGRRVVSASVDKTLKVWDLETGACLFTHLANAAYTAVAVTPTTIIAGDITGAVWLLDWPPSNRRERRHGVGPGDGNQPGSSSASSPPSPRAPMKHTILFLSANPSGTDRLALDEEARAIHVELEQSAFRDRFELVTRWAVRPLDLLRELRKLRPTVVHFSGHGTSNAADEHRPGPGPHRDLASEPSLDGGEPRHGLYFQGPDGRPQRVSTEALEATFGAAGSSVKLVVLSACYSEVHARALLPYVGCVVGMSGSIRDDTARSFAIGFYGGLGERESVATAYKQGCAAIRLEGLPDGDRPQLAVRAGVDASKLVLAADPP
jgi:hypothetical protein